MKKNLIIFTSLLILAGCSASANASVIPADLATPVVHSATVSSSFFSASSPTLLTVQNIQITRALHNRAVMKSVIRRVEARIGKTWYVFSGDQPTGWDCSGLTRWAYAQLGIEIPHSATKQAGAGRFVKSPLPGDIVLFGYKGSKSFYHAALYVGNGKVVHAGFRRGMTTQLIAIDAPAFKGSRVAYVRVLDTTP